MTIAFSASRSSIATRIPRKNPDKSATVMAMRPPQPDVGRNGWFRTLPGVANRVYLNLWFLHYQTGSPMAGDLDDPDAAAWVAVLAPTGLDEPYDPTCDPGLEGDQEEEERELERWEDLQRYARERNLPMTTSRHVIAFMLELNLIERQETDAGVIWLIVSPLPNVEEVLNLSPRRREEESKVRWRIAFEEIAQSIAGWIGEFRAPGAKSGVFTTSIQAVAKELRLDVEDARHGLTVLLDEDIQCDVDPETAAVDASLRLTVDWELFEALHTVYRAAGPWAES